MKVVKENLRYPLDGSGKKKEEGFWFWFFSWFALPTFLLTEEATCTLPQPILEFMLKLHLHREKYSHKGYYICVFF